MASLIHRLKRTDDPVVRACLLRVRGTGQSALRGHLVRRQVVRRYLASTPESKLHIGAGPVHIDGWLNTDLIAGDIYLDLTRPLPFADATFAFAFGEHVIEHLSDRTAQALMGELRRTLRPGGTLRLTTPDLHKVIALYEDRNPVLSRADYARYLDRQTGRPHERGCQVLNDYMRLWGHRWIYDEEDLRARLIQAGFSHVVRREAGESEHPPLRGLERHGGAAWVNRAEAMTLEAVR